MPRRLLEHRPRNAGV